MRTIHNHSQFNNAMQRQGYSPRRTNVESVFNFKTEMRVARKVKSLWNSNRRVFIERFFGTHIPEQLVYKIEDAVCLYGKDSQSLLSLEQSIDVNGYTALENYLVENLKLKK